VPARTFRILKQATAVSLLRISGLCTAAADSPSLLTPAELRRETDVEGVPLDVDDGYDFASLLLNDALYSPKRIAMLDSPEWRPEYALLATSAEGQTLILWDSRSDRLAFLDPAEPPPVESPAVEFSRGRASMVIFLKFSLFNDPTTQKLDSTLRLPESR
jgi:hypothetical protein